MRKFFSFFIELLMISVGCLITAGALLVFLIPNKIAAGGASGLATIIFHVWGLPVGVVILLINVPLFVAGLFLWGWQMGWRTLYATLFLSAALDTLAPYLEPVTQDPLLASLYGGIVSGLGMGLVFRARGTTGGTDLAARIINQFTGLSLGQGLILVDGLIVAAAGLVFSAELALYAAISIFVLGRSIDLVQEGLGLAKAALIVTDCKKEVQEQIIERLGRGITGIKATGGYTGREKDVLICVISRTEISKLKRIVRLADPRAFVIITAASEVLGEGFKEDWKNV